MKNRRFEKIVDVLILLLLCGAVCVVLSLALFLIGSLTYCSFGDVGSVRYEALCELR